MDAIVAARKSLIGLISPAWVLACLALLSCSAEFVCTTPLGGSTEGIKQTLVLSNSEYTEAKASKDN